MTSITEPVDIIEPVFDLLNPGIIHDTLQSAERSFITDNKSAANWNTYGQSNYQLNSAQIISPDWIQTQMQISGGSGTNGSYNALVNEAIAIECGAPLYRQGRVSIGQVVKEDNNMMYKTNLVEGFVNQELGYALTQAQHDGFWFPDRQGALSGPQSQRSLSTPGTMLFLGTSTTPSGNYPAVWDLLAGSTGALNGGNYGYFTPFLAFSANGNYLDNAVIQNRWYNPGLVSRMCRTMADDNGDSSIFVRLPICRLFPSFRDLPYVVGNQLNISLTLTQTPVYWLTTLPGSPTPSVQVLANQLWYTTYKPVDRIANSLTQFLRSGQTFKRNFQAWDCFQLQFPGSGTVSLTTLKGQAEWIWIYFQTVSRDQTYTCLKSYAENLTPSNLCLVLGGNNLPATPYATVNNSDMSRQYHDFIASTNYHTKGSAAGQLTFSDWVAYYPIYAFKVPYQEGITTSGQSLNMNINLPTTLANPTYVNVVIRYRRQVLVTYANGQEIWGNPV